MKILLLTISAEKTQREERFHSLQGGKLTVSTEPLLWYLPYLKNCTGITYFVGFGYAKAEQALEKCPEKPDLIFINDNTQSGFYPDLYKYAIPKVFYIEDLHTDIAQRTEYIKNQQIDYVIVNYKQGFYDQYPALKERMVWIPHAIDPEFFVNYNHERDIDTMLLGNVNGVYPFREFLIKNIPGLFYNKVPGSDVFYKKNLQYFGIHYVEWLNKAKIVYTCGSRYNYPLKKYFEIPACGALLMTNWFKDLVELGFVHEKNCVFIDEGSAKSETNAYLAAGIARECVAKAGENFIKEKHTWQNRADTFMNFLKEKII